MDCTRNRRHAGLRGALVTSFVTDEVEELVFNHAASHKATWIVVYQVRRLLNTLCVREEVVRLSRRGGVVPVQSTVHVVSAALELHVHGSATGQPLFSVVGVGSDVHVLDRFNV